MIDILSLLGLYVEISPYKKIYMWRLNESKSKWISILHIGRGWRFERDKKGLIKNINDNKHTYLKPAGTGKTYE